MRAFGQAARRATAVVVPGLLVAACVPAGHLAGARAPAPTFDAIAFFAGDTRGVGSLKVMTRRREPVRVAGHGVVTPDDAIVLTQDVRRGDRAVVHRTWHLHMVAPGRLAGTLSDAAGPVAGDVHGNTLHLAFAMPHGLRAQQWLVLQPGGRESRNRLVITKWGLPVASLDETITRLR